MLTEQSKELADLGIWGSLWWRWSNKSKGNGVRSTSIIFL